MHFDKKNAVFNSYSVSVQFMGKFILDGTLGSQRNRYYV